MYICFGNIPCAVFLGRFRICRSVIGKFHSLTYCRGSKHMTAVTVFAVKILSDYHKRFEPADYPNHKFFGGFVIIYCFGRLKTCGIKVVKISVDRIIFNSYRPESVKFLMFSDIRTIPVICKIRYLNRKIELSGIIWDYSAEKQLLIIRMGGD